MRSKNRALYQILVIILLTAHWHLFAVFMLVLRELVLARISVKIDNVDSEDLLYCSKLKTVLRASQ